MSPGGVLAVFAHPDDESLLAGGMLAAFVAAGEEVRVLTLTRGEHGPGPAGGWASPSERAALRERELLQAAAALGGLRVECLEYPDGELRHLVEQPAVMAAIEGRLACLRPAIVITFSEEGLYWHPDHRAVHRLVVSAARRLAVGSGPSSVPALYGVTWPQGWATGLAADLAARGRDTDLWGLSPSDFGVPDDSIDVILDVRPFLTAKLRALSCHRTQLANDHLFTALPGDLAERYLGFEYLICLDAELSAPRELEDLAERAGLARARHLLSTG